MNKEVKEDIALFKQYVNPGPDEDVIDIDLSWDSPLVQSITNAAYNELNSEKAQKYVEKLNNKFKETYLYKDKPWLLTWKDFDEFIGAHSSPSEFYADAASEIDGLNYSVEILETGYKKYFDKEYNEYVSDSEYKYQEDERKEQENSRKQQNIDNFKSVLKTQTDKLNMVKNSAAEKRRLLIK